ncbi:MAG: hypothetical protein R3186_06305 [Ruegeria sp.]|nr:hypothetical protein [Ruegeria sp.]
MSIFKLRCATWNIHRAKGLDGLVDAYRVVEAIETSLAPLKMDLLASQEADEACRPHGRIINLDRVAELTYAKEPQEGYPQLIVELDLMSMKPGEVHV